MDTRALVVLLGDCMLMEGLGDSLRNELELDVVNVSNGTFSFQEQLNELKPDMIVVDLDTPQPSNILSLLTERPGTLLLGIDHNSNQVITMKSNRYPIHSINEVCQLTQAELGCEARTQKGGETLIIR